MEEITPPLPDDERAVLVHMIEASVYGMYTACLVGDPALRVKAYLDWLIHPEVGDMVLEITTLGRGHGGGDRLGRLVGKEPYWYKYGHRRETAPEPHEQPEEWAGPIDVWILQTPDGRTVSWENCDFIRVPEHMQMMHSLFRHA